MTLLISIQLGIIIILLIAIWISIPEGKRHG